MDKAAGRGAFGPVPWLRPIHTGAFFAICLPPLALLSMLALIVLAGALAPDWLQSKTDSRSATLADLISLLRIFEWIPEAFAVGGIMAWASSRSFPAPIFVIVAAMVSVAAAIAPAIFNLWPNLPEGSGLFIAAWAISGAMLAMAAQRLRILRVIRAL